MSFVYRPPAVRWGAGHRGIDLAATLSLRDYSEAAAPDATYVYDMPDGEPLCSARCADRAEVELVAACDRFLRALPDAIAHYKSMRPIRGALLGWLEARS